MHRELDISADFWHCRRSAAVRSERWGRPPATGPSRDGGGRLAAADSAPNPRVESRGPLGPAAGPRPTMQRRSSAGASSPLGAPPQCAQSAGQGSGARQDTGFQQQSSRQQREQQQGRWLPGSPGATPVLPPASSPQQEPTDARPPPPPVPPLRLGSLGGASSPGARAKSTGAPRGMHSGGGGDGGDGGRGSGLELPSSSGGSHRLERPKSLSASWQPAAAQRPRSSSSPAPGPGKSPVTAAAEPEAQPPNISEASDLAAPAADAAAAVLPLALPMQPD